MRRLAVAGGCALLGVAALVSPARAQQAAVPDTTGFALILGGGGARGLAHVGVLRALDEMGLRPSLVVGTSMGAILGALYASGHDAATIEALLARRHWLDLLLDRRSLERPVQGGWRGLSRPQLRLRLDEWPPTVPEGVSYGQSVEGLLGALSADALYAAEGDFDRLPIPFRAVCTDVVRAEAVVIGRGSLARAARASGSLPLVFVPVPYEGRTLVDGGFVNNLPLDVARELGFSRALVVDVSNVFVATEAPSGFFGVIGRATDLGQTRQNEVDLNASDVLLRLDLRDHSALGFWGTDELVEKGYATAVASADAIRALGRASAPASTRELPRIAPVEVQLESVEVSGARRAGERAVREALGAEVGARVRPADLWHRADRLAGQARFENVWLEFEPLGGDRAELRVHVLERRLPEVALAANLREGDGAAAQLRLRLPTLLLRGGVNVLRASVGPERVRAGADASLPFPRGPELRVSGEWQRQHLDRFVDGASTDAFVFARYGGSADLVWPWRAASLGIWTGVRAESVDSHVDSRRRPGTARDWRALHLGVETLRGSTLDAPRGDGVALHVEWARAVLGGDVDGWRVQGGATRSWPWGRFLGANVASGVAWGSKTLPPEWQARAGSPQGWVGLRRDEILAPRLAWQRLGFDLYLQRELRLEVTGAVGLRGRSSLSEHRPEWGAQIQIVLDTIFGPVQAGVAGRRGAEGFAFVEAGFDF